ncbi:MAG: hypothetical protein ACYDDF_05140 [Thermoplasmatota archaeon]
MRAQVMTGFELRESRALEGPEDDADEPVEGRIGLPTRTYAGGGNVVFFGNTLAVECQKCGAFSATGAGHKYCTHVMCPIALREFRRRRRKRAPTHTQAATDPLELPTTSRDSPATPGSDALPPTTPTQELTPTPIGSSPRIAGPPSEPVPASASRADLPREEPLSTSSVSDAAPPEPPSDHSPGPAHDGGGTGPTTAWRFFLPQA